MLRHQLMISLAALAVGGCAFFAALSGQDPNSSQAVGDPAQQARVQAEADARAQEQGDLGLASEIEPLRVAANAETATLEQVLAFVDKVGVAIHSGAIERGRVPAQVVSEARADLDRQWAALEPQTTAAAAHAKASVELARGYLFLCEGRTDDAATSYLAAVTHEPTAESFALLADLPISPTSDAAVLSACSIVRKAIPAEGVPDFVAVCLDAAGEDRSRITWKGAKTDLRAHDDEMRRREEEDARIAAENAQIRAWSSAAVFAAGRCRFSDCLHDGWEASTDRGTVTTTCRFQNCLTDGWETRFPDGGHATTTCRFQDCMKDGWETRFPDGSSATTTCRFQDCAVDGWETRLPDGSSATTTCRFQKCFEDGWETRMPDGDSVTCTCKFQNCLTDGTDCN